MFKRFIKRIRPLDLESRMDQEMRFHLDEHIEMLVAEGMSPEQARKAALREFGNVECLKEECRDSWGMRFLDSSIRHLRFAGRQMRKNKGYTFIVVVTLALGIGVNSAVYTLANTVLFKPLPFPNSQQLVKVQEYSSQHGKQDVSYPNFVDFRNLQTCFSAIGLFREQGYNLIESDSSNRIVGLQSTFDTLEVLGHSPILGRLFNQEDDHPTAEATVILGERFWRTHFGAKNSVIGERINLSGQYYKIIGIWPYDFDFGGVDVWTPFGLISREGLFPNRHSRIGTRVLARLTTGTSIEQAQAQMEGIAAELAAEYPKANSGHTVRLTSLKNLYFGSSSSTVFTLLGASGFLLLIACSNVASMQLVRSFGRRQEFGLRISLGAKRSQILGQLLIENLALAAMGGLVGIALAYGATEGLKSLFADSILRISETKIDFSTFTYATLAIFISSLLFCIAPFRQILKRFPNRTTCEGPRVSESTQSKHWKSIFVVGQFALASILLIGAGLMIRTTASLYKSNPGFPVKNKMIFHWALDSDNYVASLKRFQTIDNARDALTSLPNVQEIGVAYPMPLTGNSWGQYLYVEGHPLPENNRGRSVEYIRTNHTYFEAMGIRLLSGRRFNKFDNWKSPHVAIVDTKFVELNFPNSNPIGKRITHGSGPPSNPNNWIQIVGVVEHVSHHGVASESREQVYCPLSQYPFSRDLSFVISPREGSILTKNEIREAMRQVDPTIPVRGLQNIESVFVNSFARERLFMKLLGTLATLAVILAATGLYGVFNYTVRQQTREIGIRMAIGAKKQSIRNQVFANGAKLAGIGLGIGLLSSLGLSRFISSMLYGVSSFDWPSFLVVAVLLGAVGLVACWAPAYRAMRIAPSVALRAE